MLRLTNGESSSSASRGRDQTDFGFEQIDENSLDEDIENMIIEQRSERSSRTPFDDSGDHESDMDYLAEEATESFDASDSDNNNDDGGNDEFDAMVTRGRAKQRQTTKAKSQNKKSKKSKPIKSPHERPTTRQSRTTRAASVRF